jgi:hypothetical protein
MQDVPRSGHALWGAADVISELTIVQGYRLNAGSVFHGCRGCSTEMVKLETLQCTAWHVDGMVPTGQID